MEIFSRRVERTASRSSYTIWVGCFWLFCFFPPRVREGLLNGVDGTGLDRMGRGGFVYGREALYVLVCSMNLLRLEKEAVQRV